MNVASSPHIRRRHRVSQRPHHRSRTADVGEVVLVREHPAWASMRATGEFDLSNAHVLGALPSREIARGRWELFLDMSGVRFVDPHAIDALVSVRRVCRALGGTFVLLQPSPPVRRVLRLLDLGTELERTVAT